MLPEQQRHRQGQAEDRPEDRADQRRRQQHARHREDEDGP
jgi:hypothetical protein